MITVAVDARGQGQRGQALDQFPRCEAQLHAAIGLGFGQPMNELIVADPLGALQRKGQVIA